MQNYKIVRRRIFNETPKRSTVRSKKYWANIKKKKVELLSTILVNDGDLRPYAKVKLLGTEVLGLLDSGASVSCIGGSFHEQVTNSGIKIKKLNSCVNTADGTRQNVTGVINVLVDYKNVSKMVEFYLIPSLKQNLYLGINFWKTFHIAPQILSEINEIETHPDSHDLSPLERAQLNNVINVFPSFEKLGLGKTMLVEHAIDVGNAKPIKQRYFPVSPAIEKLIHEEIDRMLSMGVIEESTSSWSSPVVLVRKPGKIRLCLDSRKVNSVTVKDAYPLPFIEGILSRLPRARYISSLDLKDAFWQIPLESGSREKTAFTIPNRPLYQYTVMPFGLCNAPQTMCRLMDKVVPPHLRERVFVYLDDLLVISEDFPSHLQLLHELALHIQKAGLTINIGKSRFCLKKLKYLGYVVGNGTLQTDPEKVSAIVDFPQPKSIRQLRRFLGLAGWYRRFISNFAGITCPLTDLLKKSKSFVWTKEAEDSFNELKRMLTSAPFLVNPDFKSPFILQCDASKDGVGAVLAQLNSEGIEVPIAFMSQKLNKAQRNYSVTEQECLAALLAVEKFRPYIEGYRFKIITDHASLKWLMSQSNLNGRLARWSLKLQGFEFVIEHRKGSENVVPDALSRVFSENLEELAVEEVDLCPEIDLNSPEFDSIEYSILRDKLLQDAAQYPDYTVRDKYIYYRAEHYRGIDSQEENCWKLLVPVALRTVLIQDTHNSFSSAHGGVGKVVERLRRYFYWPGLYTDVKKNIARCEVCKTTKHTTKIKRPPMGNQTITERIFQRLYVDLIGPLPRTKRGNMGILIVLDHLSKFTFLFPLKQFTTPPIKKLIKEQVFDVFGVPEYLHSDNGSQFRSNDFEAFLTQHGIKHILTALYSPQSNSSERVNRSVNAALRAYIKDDQKDWDDHLSSINCALRASLHQSAGFSPYFILFGQHMINHADTYKLIRNVGMVEEGRGINEENRHDYLSQVRALVKENLRKAYEVNARSYNLRSRPVSFKVGQTVLRRNFAQSNLAKGYNAKLGKTYLKAVVKEKQGSAYYVLEDEKGKLLGTYHAKDIIAL